MYFPPMDVFYALHIVRQLNLRVRPLASNIDLERQVAMFSCGM